jgi:DNA-binding MarR family transcriptional regulator
MKSEPKPAQMAAWRVFLEAHADLVRILGDELDLERGLPLSWYDVLVQLQEAGGRLRMQELADSVLLSKSGLTRLIDRMEAKGYVRREQFRDDKRGMLAILTASGRTALNRAAPGHLRGIQEHFGQYLTDAEARTIRDALTKVVRAAGREPR